MQKYVFFEKLGSNYKKKSVKAKFLMLCMVVNVCNIEIYRLLYVFDVC